MIVHVRPPAVDRDTVVFRWEQSEPNRFQRANEFFFRYDGVDLAACSATLLFEVFFGLQVNVFGAYEEPVEVVFPEPVPRSIVDFWTAFHGVTNVAVTPLAETVAYNPWAGEPAPMADTYEAVVFYGGGKDSTLAACLLAELRGTDQVLLIQYVGPLRPDPGLIERIEERQDAIMLGPVRERLGFATQRVWTDYQATFSPGSESLRPHLELYTLGALPALLARGARVSVFGTPRTAYVLRRGPDGGPLFRYARSRPEVLADQSRHYQRALGFDHTVTNVNIHFTTLMDFRLLAERYPDALRVITMCTRAEPDQRWCYNCIKCADYAIFSLACGVVDDRFDYDRFFRSSRWIRKLTEYAESGAELSVRGNADWQPFYSTDNHYPVICHAIALIDEGLIAERLSEPAMGNLLLMKAMYGNTRYPDSETISRTTLELVDDDLSRAVVRIAAEHFPVVPSIAGPYRSGHDMVEYDFSVRMPTRTSLVDHIRPLPSPAHRESGGAAAPG